MKIFLNANILRMMFIQLLCVVFHAIAYTQIVVKTTGVTSNTSKDGTATVKVVGPVTNQKFEYAIDNDNYQQQNIFEKLDTGGHIAKARAVAEDGTCSCLSCVITDSFTIKPKIIPTPPQIWISDVYQLEGSSDSNSVFKFTVKLSSPAGPDGVTFNIATGTSFSATEGSDYIGKSLTFQKIPEGSTSYTFEVSVIADNTTVEPDETFWVVLTNVYGAVLLGQQAKGTIIDDDRTPNTIPILLSLDGVNFVEGNNGETVFQFVISLSAPAGPGGVTFDIATYDALSYPATAGVDYKPRSLTGVSIPQGHSSYSFDVTIIGDYIIENPEYFSVKITNVTGAVVVGFSHAYGIIGDDDRPLTPGDDGRPSLRVDDLRYIEGNEGNKVFKFVFKLTAPAGPGGVTFDIRTWDRSAKADSDYIARIVPGAFIPPGVSTYILEVAYFGDYLYENNEAFSVEARNIKGAYGEWGENGPTGQAFAQGQIINDDPAPPKLTVDNVYSDESDSTFSFTVNLSSPAPRGEVTFDITTLADRSNRATPGQDYVARPIKSVTISEGNSSYTFDVTVLSDSIAERDESFGVLIENVTGAEGLRLFSSGRIFDDDSPKKLQTINFVPIADKTEGDEPFIIGAVASSGLPVSFSMSSDPEGVATLNGDNVALTGTGEVTITASQKGSIDFSPAEDVTHTFSVHGTPEMPACYRDSDGDGYGDANYPRKEISIPEGYVSNNWDCDDNNLEVHPAAKEIANNQDDDCDGKIDEDLHTNADLYRLMLSAASLTPYFNRATTSYTASVAESINSINITPILTDPAATVKVNGILVENANSVTVVLSAGANTITTTVTAEDGKTTKSYTVIITRTTDADANLSSLWLSNGVLSPVFSETNTSYTAAVPNGITSVTVIPTLSDPTGTVKVNGSTVTSGLPSAAIPLSIGANNFVILVTARDGTTIKTYTIVVTRAAGSTNANLSKLTLSNGKLNPIFASATTSYTAFVSNNLTSITVTPTAVDAPAIIEVNGSVVKNGEKSSPLALSVGANTIVVLVKAQDEITTKTYTITVTREASSNANLSNLITSRGTLSPKFNSARTDYLVSLSNDISSISLTPNVANVSATVNVNGTPVITGTPSPAISLNVGTNKITVAVTAQNGTVRTYIIKVTRAASGNSSLSSIVLSQGTLTPVFTPLVKAYTASVTNVVLSITVTPTVEHVTASVKINGTTVSSGIASFPIPLKVGFNTISILVTAQNQSTKTYTITVTRAAPISTNANLSKLILSNGKLSPAFTSATTSYSASVSNSLTSITVTPTAADGSATVKVNGSIVKSGIKTSPVPLSVGANSISILVTAQDGKTTKAYIITVIRETSGNANLSNIVLSQGTLTPVFAPAIKTYTTSVTHSATSITVTPTAADNTSTITVNGTSVPSGNKSPVIPLTVGKNSIRIIVTAQNLITLTYSITVNRETAPCSPPSGLSAESNTGNSALLKWNAVSGAISYTLQWKPASASSNWTTVGSTTASYNLNGLTPGAIYSFQVLATCSNGKSEYSAPATFTTPNNTCSTPTNLSTIPGPVLGWDTSQEAVSYTLQWKLSSANSWNTISGLSESYYALNDCLPSAANFTYRVASVCINGTSSYSAPLTFSTWSLGYPCRAPLSPVVKNITNTSATIEWNPRSLSVSKYKLLWKASSAITWTTGPAITATATSHNLTGLTAGTQYSVKLDVECQENAHNPESDCGYPSTFTTTTTMAKAAKVTNNIDKFTRKPILSISPNPVTSATLTASYNLENNGNVKLKVIDLSGRLNQVEMIGYQKSGAYNHYLQFKEKLATGIYVMVLEQDNKVIERRKFVVSTFK